MDNGTERGKEGARIFMEAMGIPTDEEMNELILREFKKYADNGVIDYVLPTDPLGEEWVIGYRGNILKFSTEQAHAWLLGAAAVTLRIATQRGVI